MKSKKFLKIDLFLLVVIGLLASFTYNPTNAKFFKKSDEALTYSANFYKMSGDKIPDENITVVPDASNGSVISYRIEFGASNYKKEGEVDKYTLDIPNGCEITYPTPVDGTSFIVNDNKETITARVSCPAIETDNKIKLSVTVKQQFLSATTKEPTEREYILTTGSHEEDASKYFDNYKDKLQGDEIYLFKNNDAPIYPRFEDLLKTYIKNNKELSDALNEYLTDHSTSLENLLDEYLKTKNASITIVDKNGSIIVNNMNGINPKYDKDYYILEVTDDFIDDFKNYFISKDYLVGNKIKLSKSYTGEEIVAERIVKFLATQENIESKDIVPYIEKSLGNLSNIPSEYGKIKELKYSDSGTYDVIEIGPNFSSYVKTSSINDNINSSPKNFYFYNASLDAEGINTLFYEYLDEYLCENYSKECEDVKKYVQDNLNSTTITSVIDLANKLNSNQYLNYFNYDSSEHLLHITSDFYNIILNKKENKIIHEILRSREPIVKINSLESKLRLYNYNQDVIDEILSNSKINEIFAITDATEKINSGEIPISVTVKNTIYKIKVEITSPAGYNFINIIINITEETSTNGETNGNDEPTNEVVTPPIDDVSGEEVTEDPVKDPSEEVTEDKTDTKEKTETETNKEDEEKEGEEVKATDPEVEVDTKTQDEVGIISYPIDSTLDNTLGEEKKYIYIKPEDE